MVRLLNFVLVGVWTSVICGTQVNNSPSLTDVSKIRQTYVAWPANTPLSLKCKAEGEPPLKIKWYKDGKLIKYSAKTFQDQKWNLKFRKPQLSDNGVYTCIVSNDHGWVKHNYSLQILQRIQSLPELVPGYPKSVTVLVGDNVELECLEKPNSQVTHYRWVKTFSAIKADKIDPYEKDNVNWISSKNYRSFEIDEDGRKLHGVKLELQHVTEKDKGYYSCFLSNSIGHTFGTAYLNVIPMLPTDPPEFLIPKNKRLHFIATVEKEDVTFSCLVRGGAPLKYHWFYNGELLKPDEAHEIRESELTVRHVQSTDEGVYTCRIKNDYGHVKHSFKLKVLPRAPLHPGYPRLLPGFPKNTTAVVGNSASLYCAVTSDAIIDYRWLKWDKTVKTFTKDDFQNKTMFTILHPKHYEQRAYSKKGVYLKINNLTKADQGLYTCLAINMHMGFSYRSAFLTVKDPFQRHYDGKNPIAWLPERITQKPSHTSQSKRRCFAYKENVEQDELEDVKLKCETSASCASIRDERTGGQKMFCDEENLCGIHNITSGECAEITVGNFLCCCIGELCNQPENKLFQKAKKNQDHSVRSRLMPVIFFSTLVVTISVMLAFLAYRIRQRKAALKESIVHKTKPSSRKMTKQIIMETKWMKEDI